MLEKANPSDTRRLQMDLIFRYGVCLLRVCHAGILGDISVDGQTYNSAKGVSFLWITARSHDSRELGGCR